MQTVLTALNQLFTWGKALTTPLFTFLQSPRGRRQLRLLGYLFMAAALLFIGITLARSWQQVRPYLATMNLRLLLWAQLCTFLAYLSGGVLWLMVLRAFGIGVPWQWGLMAHFIANTAKYLPGYGWQYISKGVLLREQGKGPKEISTILLTEVLILFSSGIVAALLAGAWVGQVWYYAWRVAPWLWWIGVFVVIGITFVWHYLTKRVVVTDHSPLPRRTWLDALIAQKWLWVGWGISFIGWLIFAAATLLCVNALEQITTGLSLRIDFLQSLFALVVAGLVSFLVIIVPGGFGVREATLAALLNGLLAFNVATIVSIITRFAVILSELIGLICLPYLLRYRSTRVKTE